MAAEGAPLSCNQSLVVHQDALDAACQAASLSVDQLLWQGGADVARAVALLGPGLVVLPMLGRVSGVDERKCLAYGAHPRRAARGGLMDRVDLESKFGQLDPARLSEELTGGRLGLEKRLQALSNEELKEEVLAFQDWRTHANGRLKTLEKRAAWAFLGIRVGSATQEAIKKAFKRKALELHPDKGGDAERFQLLQEMKDLLVVPTSKEIEEMSKEKAEKDEEVKKAKEQAKERKNKEEEDEDVDADFSSDDSWDADEELRKMFPKKNKRKKRVADDDEGQDSINKDEHFNRDKYEAARRKLHRNFVEMWERAGKLSEEIKLSEAAGNTSEPLRQLRKFVDRFANLEISKLKENDPQKAERIFRRFLEQGSEVLCAAAAADPVATVSCIAMQVNYPLMAICPSENLKERCSVLLEAIEDLPAIFGKYVMPLEERFRGRRRAEEAAVRATPIKLRLLVPDEDELVERGGVELPGVSEVPIELPPGSCLADLRAAAAHLCKGGAPRLFCKGRFIAGAASALLAEFESLREGWPIQCLPSNRFTIPRCRPSGGAASSGSPPHATSTRHAGYPEQTQPPGSSSATAAAVGSEGAGTGRVSRELKEALGLAERKAGILVKQADDDIADAGSARPRSTTTEGGKAEEVSNGEPPAAPAAAPEAAAPDEAQTPTSATTPPVPTEKVQSAGRDGDATTAGGEADGEEEDPWFDDFFTKTKTAAEEEAERKNAEEEQERKRAQAKKQAQGQSAMEARIQAQKKAAEAKKKLELEKKAKRKQTDAAAKCAATKVNGQEPKSGAATKPEVERKAATSCELVVQADRDKDIIVNRSKACWDSTWSHPCAGERRADGSAVFCHPCDAWVSVCEPFDHRDFELHCEKVGHYGWID